LTDDNLLFDDLYGEVVRDHAKRPRNFGHLENATAHADGHNPLCGDRLSLELKLDGDVIKDARFVGAGCAISTASASLMTETVKGKTRAEAEQIFNRFHQFLTTDHVNPEEMGKLQVFSGVHKFPVRVKCATLSWHTLKAALENSAEQVTTE
jgi:nitrogen fixation NifU-like protein